jgi:type II secretory pathway pseudopilin PulG
MPNALSPIKRSNPRTLWYNAVVSFRNFRADEQGNIAILGAIMLPVMIGAVGAAVSFSSGNATRTNLQSSLDAAVLGGLSESNTGLTPVTIAETVFKSNINGFSSSTTSNIHASFKYDGTTLTGEAEGTASNPLGGVIGTATYRITARSAAIKQNTKICVLGLNGMDKGSFDVNGNPVFNADCAVQANSTSTSGMTQEGRAPVKARKFGVSGNSKTNAFSPQPINEAPAVKDPYASIPFPFYNRCGTGKQGLDIKSPTTLSPGTYCGGITISGSDAKVTLQPGIYVMVNGPFWVKGGGVVEGKEVMIAFTGKDASLYLWGNSAVTLTSPVSGTYKNFQFFSDRDSGELRGTWVSIGGAAGNPDGTPKLSYDGVAYFPNQNFWMFGNAVVNANSPTMTIVADKVWVQGSATVNITNENPRKLRVPAAPEMAFGARLIN